MNLDNAKITQWKNFVQFFRFHQFWSSGQFSILAVFQNVWDLHKFGLQIWFQNSKNYPMKEFRAIFPFSSILVIRSGYAKKYNFSILPVIQNIWDLHKFGSKIWIQNAKITLMKKFWVIFLISSILVIRSVYAKQGRFWILALFQHIWDLHKFGLQIWIQNAKITLWKNFGQFFHFHRFWSSGKRVCKKTLWKNFSILPVIQNIWDLHKFGSQIWIQNAKITLWKNFG